MQPECGNCVSFAAAGFGRQIRNLVSNYCFAVGTNNLFDFTNLGGMKIMPKLLLHTNQHSHTRLRLLIVVLLSISLLATVVSPAATASPKTSPVATKATPELVPYQGPIEHIFFHPLIAYPTLAFDGDRMAQGYDDWFVTVKEFKRILQALYQRNYVLIDIRSIYTEKIVNGQKTLVRNKLVLPKNKKPLIISIDDLNYYDYMRQNGNVHKLILDAQGKIATYSVTPQGKSVIAYDNEIVPILEQFVKEHPDFSFRGAKGVIALTGYQGILGYRTNNPAAPNYQAEKTQALKVVRRLKETGWVFASHSYGHHDMNKVTYQTFVKDTDRWLKEVKPLIGATPVYIYPFGSRIPATDPKFRYLTKMGFKVMCGVGPTPYLKITPDAIQMDRRHIDGIALRTQGDKLRALFDSKAVIDKESRK